MKNEVKKHTGKGENTGKKAPAMNFEENRPFELEGHFLSHDDVTFLAEYSLYNAILPSTITTETQELDGKGVVAGKTITTQKLPGNWEAAARWLEIQALRARKDCL